ncbi:MAG: FlgO family outer membrane protein [Gemmatimonadaceae bacterium]
MSLPPSEEPLLSGLADRYTVERELGGGGMSRVFLATERELNRQVVIKVLSTDVAAGVSLERFGREIQLAASLQQANIVPLLSAGNVDGVPYYTMPYVDGESLRTRLQQGQLPSISKCVGILRDVARALSYAHGHGVVHRDIKPDNILLSHGLAVVADFGIAKAVSASRARGEGDTLTQVGTSLGTPAYMSPEQVAGDPNVDHRADIYAWGCVGYELLTGEPPFVRFSPQRVMAAHLSETPVPVTERRADVPPLLARLVMQALAKEPADRPQDARLLVRELEGAFTPGAETPAVVAPPKGASRLRIIGAGIAMLVLTVALLLAWRARQPSGTPSSAASTSTDRSIAVLPLANLSGDKADDFFGIGLAEEMTRALAKSGVRVIGRSSAAALMARGLDEQAIARELGVGSILTGTVQRADGQVRINVSLLKAEDGAVRWSEKYDRPLTNVFAVQDEIARTVATQLLGSLGGTMSAGSLMRNETSSPEAHAMVLNGIVLWNRRSAPALRQAIALFQQAVAIDQRYARAYAWLALANVTLAFYVDDPTDTLLVRATNAANQSIAIDSTIGEAWTAAANVFAMQGRNRDADNFFRQSLARDSTLAITWFWHGLLAMRTGDFTAAELRVQRALDLEPASLVVRAGLAQGYLAERKSLAADSLARTILSRDSTFALAWLERANALVGIGRTDEALVIYEQKLLGQLGARPMELSGQYAWALAVAGRKADAQRVLDRLKGANGGNLPPVAAVAAALDRLGDREGGLNLLAEAMAKHDPWLLPRSHSERFDALRATPRGLDLFTRFEAK